MTETEAEQLLADLAAHYIDREPYDPERDVTVQDVMARFGVSEDVARDRLNALAAAGMLTKRSVRIPGKPPTMMAYRRARSAQPPN